MRVLLIIVLSTLTTTSCVGMRFGNTCSSFGMETESVEVLDFDAANPDTNFTQTEFRCRPKTIPTYKKRESVK